MADRPTNDHDAIIQLWDAVIGTNGQGLCEQVQELVKIKKREVRYAIGLTLTSTGLLVSIIVMLFKVFV